jgi:hypothetical protein
MRFVLMRWAAVSARTVREAMKDRARGRSPHRPIAPTRCAIAQGVACVIAQGRS